MYQCATCKCVRCCSQRETSLHPRIGWCPNLVWRFVTSPSAPVMTSAHLIVIHVSVLADSISKHARLNAGKKGLPIYAPQYCNNTCNLLAPAPSVHHSCVLTELFEVKLQGDFASFPQVWRGFLVQLQLGKMGQWWCQATLLLYSSFPHLWSYEWVLLSLSLPRSRGIPPRFHWPEWGSAATIAARTATRIWETCYGLRLDAEDKLLRENSGAPGLLLRCDVGG